MRITTDDGVELEVTVHGEGPGLLLVHGFGGAKEDFHDHVEVLARTHTVVTFDHRGHGASDKPDDPASYSFARLGADIVAVADAVGFDEFVLLGHSMGGMISRRVAVDHAHRISGLILMDTSHGPVPGFDLELLQFGAAVAFEQGKDALKELLDSIAPLETPAYQQILETRPGYREYVDRKWNDLSHIMWGALIVEIGGQPDELELLAGVRVPTLVIVGDQDTPFLAASQAMADAIPGARLAVIPDAGHSPQFENPPAWADAMVAFLLDAREETESVA